MYEHKKFNHGHFQCKHCSYSTRFKKSFKNHIENAHDYFEEGQLGYHCRYCNFYTEVRESLNSHMKTHLYENIVAVQVERKVHPGNLSSSKNHSTQDSIDPLSSC